MDLTKTTLQIFSKLEHDWLYQYEPKSTTKTRILSIDGSASTCAFTAAVLIHLEKQIVSKTGDKNARIADFFDLIAGTGTGAVYASLLSSCPTLPASGAAELVAGMFPPPTTGFFRRSNSKIEKVLKEAFRRGDGKVLTLKDACKPIIVPCYDLTSSAPFVFSRADAFGSDSYDFELWKVCRATLAAPTGVRPFGLTSVDGRTSCLAVGGGIVMNNPAAAAVTHALHNKRDFPNVNRVEDLLVLSLGNSGSLGNGKSMKFCRKGACLSSSLVGIAVDSVSEATDQMLANAFCLNRSDYVRIQVNCDTTGVMKTEMEHVLSERGVETLPFGGKRFMTENNCQLIENLVKRIVASGKTSLPPSPCKETVISPLVTDR